MQKMNECYRYCPLSLFCDILMNEWRILIRCYISPAGNNAIAEWHASLRVQERADADSFLTNMRKTREQIERREVRTVDYDL